jgi:hypothetical protein
VSPSFPQQEEGPFLIGCDLRLMGSPFPYPAGSLNVIMYVTSDCSTPGQRHQKKNEWKVHN